MSQEMFDKLVEAVIEGETDDAKVFAISCAFGRDYTLTIDKGYSPIYNDPEVAELIR
jgi:hypothetical protein